MVKTLGQRIRELREAQDRSVRELARKLDVSAAFLSDVELGRRYPSDKVLAKIAQVLGTSLGALKEHDTRPPVEELKRLTAEDPAYGLAFRRVIDRRVSPDALLRLTRGKDHRKGKR